MNLSTLEYRRGESFFSTQSTGYSNEENHQHVSAWISESRGSPLSGPLLISICIITSWNDRKHEMINKQWLRSSVINSLLPSFPCEKKKEKRLVYPEFRPFFINIIFLILCALCGEMTGATHVARGRKKKYQGSRSMFDLWHLAKLTFLCLNKNEKLRKNETFSA